MLASNLRPSPRMGDGNYVVDWEDGDPADKNKHKDPWDEGSHPNHQPEPPSGAWDVSTTRAHHREWGTATTS